MGSLDEHNVSVKAFLSFKDVIKQPTEELKWVYGVCFILQSIERIPPQLSYATSNLNFIKTSLIELVEMCLNYSIYMPYNFELTDLILEVKQFMDDLMFIKRRNKTERKLAFSEHEYDLNEVRNYTSHKGFNPKTLTSFNILNVIYCKVQLKRVLHLEIRDFRKLLKTMCHHDKMNLVDYIVSNLDKTTDIQRKLIAATKKFKPCPEDEYMYSSDRYKYVQFVTRKRPHEMITMVITYTKLRLSQIIDLTNNCLATYKLDPEIIKDRDIAVRLLDLFKQENYRLNDSICRYLAIIGLVIKK